MTPDLFQSTAFSVLLQLEADGFTFKVEPDRLLISPADRLTPAVRAILLQHKPDILAILRCLDDAVLARRDAFVRQQEAAPPGHMAVFLFVPGLAYVAGCCFSCGDALTAHRIGRCWRCAVAWRLAVGVPVHRELAEALDGARVSG